MPNTPSIEVLLFGALKDTAHANRVDVVLPTDMSTLSLEALRDLLAQQHPALARYLPHVRIAVNCEYSSGDEQVKPGDEVALIPPVAGG